MTEPEESKESQEYGAVLIAVIVIVGLILVFNQEEAPETVTVRVLGDRGVPYDLTYENSRESHTARGVVQANPSDKDYTIDVLTSSSADDYVRATASKREGADDIKPTEGDLVNVDLQLVAQDGTILDEARGDGMLSYSLNSTSVEVDGEDIR